MPPWVWLFNTITRWRESLSDAQVAPPSTGPSSPLIGCLWDSKPAVAAVGHCSQPMTKEQLLHSLPPPKHARAQGSLCCSLSVWSNEQHHSFNTNNQNSLLHKKKKLTQQKFFFFFLTTIRKKILPIKWLLKYLISHDIIHIPYPHSPRMQHLNTTHKTKRYIITITSPEYAGRR